MAESEELKSLLMKVKESEKVGLKLNIHKAKIMASDPITSCQMKGLQSHTWLSDWTELNRGMNGKQLFALVLNFSLVHNVCNPLCFGFRPLIFSHVFSHDNCSFFLTLLLFLLYGYLLIMFCYFLVATTTCIIERELRKQKSKRKKIRKGNSHVYKERSRPL